MLAESHVPIPPIGSPWDCSSKDKLMNMIITFIIIVDVIVVHCFLNGLHLLTTGYSNIMYVNVRRESRTCGIPVPSFF
jgi:hypothetical protein